MLSPVRSRAGVLPPWLPRTMPWRQAGQRPESVACLGERMTSEPDSTPRRRPPTIDLTAKEVESDAPSSAGSAAADAAEARTAQDDAPGKPGKRKDPNFLTSAK